MIPQGLEAREGARDCLCVGKGLGKSRERADEKWVYAGSAQAVSAPRSQGLHPKSGEDMFVVYASTRATLNSNQHQQRQRSHSSGYGTALLDQRHRGTVCVLSDEDMFFLLCVV